MKNKANRSAATEWTEHDTWEIVSGLLVLALMIAPLILLFLFMTSIGSPEDATLPREEFLFSK